MKDYIDVHKRGAAYDLSRAVNKRISSIPFEKTIIVLCIGTDRSTGDSLGPLVGYRLGKYKLPYIRVVGNLEWPVHAANLAQSLERIRKEIPYHYIIAIDACLGMTGHIGRITVGNGPIRPGAGLKKDLPETGDMHVTGIVNHGGWMEFMVLQNTRLSLVMKMAETIADGLHHALWKYNRSRTEYLNRSIR
ncbi:MAG: spore protease YyaC [Clostridiaceae bacterium]|nr:spore protease YyaC [Clostridiaceae bacterium]